MLIDCIWAQALSTPGKAALVHNGAACSYAGFAHRIAQACAFMSACRLPPAGVAVLCVDDLAQAWLAGIALRHLGLNTVSVAQPADIAGLALDDIACVVCSARLVPPDVGCRLIMLPADWGKEDAGPDLPPMPASPAARPGGHILLTSGTTGFHKKVLRDALVEAATIDLHAEINGITAASVVYVRDFPQWTAGGYRWPLLSWHQGATVVFQQGEDFHLPLLSPATTHAYATPVTLMFALHTPELLQGRRHDGLRLLVTGGAMPRALAAALQQRLTRQVFTMLASTEAATLASTPLDELDDLPWHRIHPSRTVQVVDEADQPLPAGQVGLLRVKILDGVDGYLNDEAASRAFFRCGWFYPGDLAVFRADGRMAMCGRVTEVINVLGHKIPTAPIEAALQDRLAATAVCLLSLPGPGGDEEVHVALETARPLEPELLKAAAEDLLGRFGGAFFHQFRELPRNRMGKVLRTELHRQLLARRR